MSVHTFCIDSNCPAHKTCARFTNDPTKPIVRFPRLDRDKCPSFLEGKPHLIKEAKPKKADSSTKESSEAGE